jgi:LCP family protein required for cell wall assembly
MEEENYYDAPATKGKRKRKKRRTGRKILTCFVIIVSIVIGNLAGRLQYQIETAMSLVNRDVKSDLDSVDVGKYDLISSDKVVNILLVGTDKRSYDTEDGRSDSTMIATLDGKNKRLKITSLMRDMYVSIPGYEDNRFNAAYSFGGVTLLYQTIAQNFGIKLDGFVQVDFVAFKAVINQIGGVKVDLTEWECNYLKNKYPDYGKAQKLKAGVNRLNGWLALAYSRIRYDENGDFGRTQRQRNIIQGIFKKVKSMPMSKIQKLMEKTLPYITTDLTDQEILSYVSTVMFMGTLDIDQFRLPVDGSYTDQTIRGMEVLVLDFEENKQALSDFIFNYDGDDA